MDSDSQAAGAVLAALGQTVAVFTELHHPYVRHQAFSYLLPAGGAVAGTVFTLPDGREVHFAVTLGFTGDSFTVSGTAAVEDSELLSLPPRTLHNLDDALSVLDSYVDEIAESSRRLVDTLFEDLAR
ncbi:hypothetical protein [Nonomuraea sp. NPDC050310]|uniref:hypothetical protein n=1 Tax=unclassified Nonomuraea TaxID=2593643 RepID=UPI00340717BC